MSVNKNGNLRPDGISVQVPLFAGRIGGAYYWNPGSPTAPHLTLSRSYGMPGFGLHAVFLRNGMTSQDALGHGISGNVSTGLPSVITNGTIPDDGYLPWKSRVSSVEAGIGTPNASPAITNTYTPQQIAAFLNKYIFGPAMGLQDELSQFTRSLQSGVGTVGQASEPPVRFLGSRYQYPLGGGMAGWKSSVEGIDPRWPAVPMPPQQPAPEPGGLLGLTQEYRRSYGDY